MGKRSFFVLTILLLTLLAAPATGAGSDPVYPSPLSQLLRVDADGSALQQVVPSHVARAFSSLDADTVNGKVYWSGFGENVGGPLGFIGRVRRANLDGSNVQDVNNGEGSVRVDPAGGKLYYTIGSDCDPCTTIGRSNLNGSNPQTLATKVSFTPLALHAAAGKIYWYHAGNIIRANLDGSGQQVAFAVGGRPLDMEIDAINFKIYWAENPSGPEATSLHRANLDGSGQELLAGDLDPEGIKLALDVAGDRLWWTAFSGGTIHRARLDATEVTTIRSGLEQPRGIAYVAGPGQGGGRLYFLGNPQLVYEPVPATSEWGVLAMLLLLGAGSSIAALRRKAGASGRN